jgi:hypothetical protein
VSVSDGALDDLLHEEIRHRIGGGQSHVACAFEKFSSVSLGWKCGGSRIDAAALGLFKRASQQRIVTAFRSEERAHAVGQLKTDATRSDLFDNLVAHGWIALELIEQADEFLVGQRFGILRQKRDTRGQKNNC